MELKHYFTVVWKWLWLILVSTTIAGGVSYYTTSQQPKVYQASAKLLVGQSIQNPDPNSSDIYTSQQLAQTYIQIAKTSPVLQETIDALGVKLSSDQLNGMSNAWIIQGTQLIQVGIVDTNPARAQALANELAHQLTLQGPASAEQDQAKRREFARNQADSLQKNIEAAQNKIADLQSSIQVTASAREIADKQQQINALQSQVTQWSQSYASLLTFLAPQSPNYLSIIEPASLPRDPIGPNVLFSTAVAAAIGLILALAGAFLIEYLDDTLKNPEEITRVLQLPTLGSIARINGPAEEKLVTALAPRSSVAEAFRVLRTNIQFSSMDHPAKSLMIASSGPMEGKSLITANLAIVMAQAGIRTILIDADLRRPVLHQLFGLSNDVGLTNGLIQHSAVDSFARPVQVENLRVVTTGPLPPNPAEVLGSKRMHDLYSRLQAEADIVLFDSAPGLALADAAILARLVDGVILIVDTTRTHRDSARRVKEMIEKVGGRVLGVVLNRISPHGAGHYQYYYYYYSHDGNSSRKRKAASPGQFAMLSHRVRGLIWQGPRSKSGR